jgi:hypothetical protein
LFRLSSPATKLMSQVLDSNFVEHDAYILFDKLMTFGKSWYEFNDDVPSRKTPNARIKVITVFLYRTIDLTNSFSLISLLLIIYPSLLM